MGEQADDQYFTVGVVVVLREAGGDVWGNRDGFIGRTMPLASSGR
ncbi:MAG: hypothetical protein ACRDRJ_25355 [Streptosporangiaceae bacterium]